MKKSIADGLRNLRIRVARYGWRADKRGSAAVVVALTMAGLIALLALGIDLGALFDARSEAQRAADAAALAGASAFLDYQQSSALRVAEDRAVTYATDNAIRGRAIMPGDVTIAVNTDSNTVRASVRRNGVPTWFARLFGVDSVDVSAEATAWAGEAGAAQCVTPFALPDTWDEKNDDLNHNRIWDQGERWKFDPGSGDRYVPYSGAGGAASETGYGSSWRDGYADSQGRRFDGDYGRRIVVKTATPQEAWTSSIFLPWVLPPDPDQPDCGSTPPRGGQGSGDGGQGGDTGGDGSGSAGPGQGKGTGWFKWMDRRGGLGGPGGGQETPGDNGNGGGNNGSGGSAGNGGNNGPVDRDSGKGRGAARYRQNICSCNASAIDLDTEYMIEPGNMVGPTYQGVQALIDQDPTAYWDDQKNTLVSKYGMDSPRVVTMAVFSPDQLSKPGRQYVRFNNFVRVFIEAQASPKDPVTGRLLYYARGVGTGREGATTGSLVRVLQLIR